VQAAAERPSADRPAVRYTPGHDVAELVGADRDTGEGLDDGRGGVVEDPRSGRSSVAPPARRDEAAARTGAFEPQRPGTARPAKARPRISCVRPARRWLSRPSTCARRHTAGRRLEGCAEFRKRRARSRRQIRRPQRARGDIATPEHGRREG
jgi:hypothetical protein